MSKRWCSLSGTHFLVFKDENYKNNEYDYLITPNTRIEIIEEDSKPRFRLTQPDGDYNMFEAESVDSLMRWVLALRGCTFENPDMSMEQFKIIAVIGRGFYGKVMLCENKTTHEIVAIKSIHKSRLIQSNKVHTVIAERNILTKVQHPFIVSLRFAFQTASKFYLGLEYAPGGELFFHMQKNGSLPLYDIKLYIAEICMALHHLHSIGIVYRDLKPENILLDKDGYIKLTDFGLSKDMSYATQTNTFCGTSEYLAPEIVHRQPYTVAVDWWAVGILTYELLFGVTPFAHSNRARLFQNILEKEPTFPINTNPQILRFISALLTKDAKLRPNYDQIIQMPFFEGINFDDLLAKKIKPTFIPRVEKSTQPINFDKEFTQETPQDSFVLPVFGSAEQFPGFSYVDVTHLNDDSSPPNDIKEMTENLEEDPNQSTPEHKENTNDDGMTPSSLKDDYQPISPI
ncbi:AGC family protein kinase [Trichomonas vaginalis G3]|uniref:AGC family protein kinase n=1 Tax=Trichomonas vaginalis (strain ATCC PRA-98 / G3) TaxID=412133 RepID=A2G3J0_TRIV3|nr:protein serine/threonine kinase protein [Trichomonas vaginalis G3]EAX88277.1 AGC family protein kinase [Trichomonas vaginalis G3]KAI5528748.1 protein serine/threonine kinase protein [Trichomonas vaginalis G3]|eukprot:XP_001301207.1 AGC family protein kinase [Trichomonas vaginalis G3]